MSSIEERLKNLYLDLPSMPRPLGRFVHGVQHGDLLYLSGQGPLLDNGTLARGKVGADVSTDEAIEHARSAIGVASLPNGISVEIEAIVAIRTA